MRLTLYRIRTSYALVLERFDYRVPAQIGGVAANESCMETERVRGQRVIVAHVVGRHQDVLTHDRGEGHHRDAAVGPTLAVVRGCAVAINTKIGGVVSAVVEANRDATCEVGGERRLEMIGQRRATAFGVVIDPHGRR